MSEKVADGWEEKEGEKEVSSTYIYRFGRRPLGLVPAMMLLFLYSQFMLGFR